MPLLHSPSSLSKTLLPHFSPISKAFCNKLFQQCIHDIDPNDNSSELALKKQYCNISLETKITSGSAIIYSFHQLYYNLDKYKSYLPLSIFTNHSLYIILHKTNFLTLKNINPFNFKSNPFPFVLDIDVFERKYGQEESSSHPAVYRGIALKFDIYLFLTSCKTPYAFFQVSLLKSACPVTVHLMGPQQSNSSFKLQFRRYFSGI